MRVAPWALAFLLLAPAQGLGDEERTDRAQVLRALLALRAPLPDWKAISEATRRPGPTREERALARFADAPEAVGHYVYGLPTTPEVIAKVAALYEAERRAPAWEKGLAENVHGWLMAHSDAYKADLVAAAQRDLKPDPEGGVKDEDALETLEARDWAAAAEILRARTRDFDADVRVYALCRLYAKSDDPERSELRARLKSLAADPGCTVYERHESLKALMVGRSDGDTEWFLSLFRDPTLQELERGNNIYHPLQWWVARDPDRWIPLLVPLVGGPDRPAHDNAVACLVQFHGDKFREAALRPLLPWVGDPAWATARDRLRLLQDLDRLVTAADVPALTKCLDANSEWEVKVAATELLRLEAISAIPALRRTLDRVLAERWKDWKRGAKDDGSPDREVLRALDGLGGVDDETALRCVTAYAVAGAEAVSPDSWMGKLLRFRVAARLTTQVEERARALEAEHPAAAAHLRGLLVRRSIEIAIDDLLARLKDGTIDAPGVEDLLKKKEDVLRLRKEPLAQIAKGGGFAGGVAAAVLGDPAGVEEILAAGDTLAQQALTACARLLRMPLRLDPVVGWLKHEDAGLRYAAQRYLESEDSPRARFGLRRLWPNEARILGLRPGSDAGHFTYEVFDRREEELRREVLAEGGPYEVFALLTAGYWGGRGHWIVRRRGNGARVTFEPAETRDAAPPEAWELPVEDLVKFVHALEAEAVDDLPAYDPGIHDGLQYEYVHLTRAGGRRVYMNNPGPARGEKTEDVYARLVTTFAALRRTQPR